MMSKWILRPSDDAFTTVGTEEAFFDLYKATKQKRYVDFAAHERFGKRGRVEAGPLRTWEQDIYEARKGPNGYSCHVYRLVARILFQLELYRIEKDPGLLKMAHRLLQGISGSTKSGMVIPGGCGYDEVWNERHHGGPGLAEACATYYLTRFLDNLLRIEGNMQYGDILERMIYDTLFAAQSPDGRYVRYHTPFHGKRVCRYPAQPGYFPGNTSEATHAYFGRDTYCCPNNFRRAMSILRRMIYYEFDDGVALNLYTSSTAHVWLADGLRVTLEQRTDYPM